MPDSTTGSELRGTGTCGFCGLYVDLDLHGECRAKPPTQSLRSLVQEVYVRGYVIGRGPPPDNNLCRHKNCYLERGHKGDHKPWPKHPPLTPSKSC